MESPQFGQEISLKKHFIKAWQEKVYSHQSRIFKGLHVDNHQASLFQENDNYLIIVTPNPITYLLMPIIEYMRIYYSKFINKIYSKSPF